VIAQQKRRRMAVREHAEPDQDPGDDAEHAPERRGKRQERIGEGRTLGHAGSLPYRRASRESRAANGVAGAAKRIFPTRWKNRPRSGIRGGIA